MKIIKTKFDDVKIVQPAVFSDERGYLIESYQYKRYREAGIVREFAQDNLSFSKRGTLRGLHYQHPHSQAKLVHVVMGKVLDVIVDIRRGSSTFSQWEGYILSDQNKHQLFVPEGFAHGYFVLSKTAILTYKCSDYYAPDCEKGVLWSDSGLKIQWPVKNPILSEKDRQYPLLKEIPTEFLPEYR